MFVYTSTQVYSVVQTSDENILKYALTFLTILEMPILADTIYSVFLN